MWLIIRKMDEKETICLIYGNPKEVINGVIIILWYLINWLVELLSG